ncbi:hypothetical protein BpHYR1_036576 [Brachionus plicatilis]|uniref:Uncharacterized protein n=1 Tax=Brachionus plicatilis TaxID=10195 RepID=A0A3M7QSE9_BRAPC|nr:hypothetical protein BpHYR1_036576 [Brachionus plicatilis]
MARKGAYQSFDGENMSYDEFFNAFGYDSVIGKAKEAYQSMRANDKNNIETIFKVLKEIAVKPASHYLNIFNTKTMKPGEKLAKYCRELEVLLNKAMPGLQQTFKEQLLKDKVIKSVAATNKLLLELVVDKKWNEIVAQCEKRGEHESADEVNADEVTINKFERRGSYDPKNDRKRFEGECFYCQKKGDRKSECRKRLADMRRKGESKDPREQAETYKQYQGPQRHLQSMQKWLSKEKASLKRVDATVELDKSKVNIPVLIDSGATASFINISKLLAKLADRISRFIDGDATNPVFGLKRIDL